MNLEMDGKVAIVFAASKGLGKAAALALAREGCRVAICSRNEQNIHNAAKEIRDGSGGDILTDIVDLSEEKEIQNFINLVFSKWGSIDILVTNAGGPPVKSFLDTTEKEWHSWFDITFMSVVRSIKIVTPIMQKNNWGRIINITSVSVKSPVENLVYSNALRMAVVGLAKTLASELGPQGITVNNVAPGYHLTEGLERIIKNKIESGMKREEVLDSWTQKIPLGRIGVPDDLAGLITFLASEKASYLTGTTIQVEGGLYSGTL